MRNSGGPEWYIKSPCRPMSETAWNRFFESRYSWISWSQLAAMRPVGLAQALRPRWSPRRSRSHPIQVAWPVESFETNAYTGGESLAKLSRDESSPSQKMFVGRNVHISPVDGKTLCSYSKKKCNQRRMEGFAFCNKHVLEVSAVFFLSDFLMQKDPACPFKQCQFLSQVNGRQCSNPIPIGDTREYVVSKC